MNIKSFFIAATFLTVPSISYAESELNVGDVVFERGTHQVGEVIEIGAKYIRYRPENSLAQRTIVKRSLIKQNLNNICVKTICVRDRIYDYFYNETGTVTRTFGDRYVEYSYGVFDKRKIVRMNGDEKL